MRRIVHPIEEESYAILRGLVDLSEYPPLSRAVVERVIHATADLGYATDLVTDEDALDAGRQAIAAGRPIVTDVRMVAAGIASDNVRCALPEVAQAGATRTAQGIRDALGEVGPGAVWVIGCAPTALTELIALDADPALVIGLPVGFVGSVEAKAALRSSGLPGLSNRGPKGGSAAAVAAVNALVYGGDV